MKNTFTDGGIFMDPDIQLTVHQKCQMPTKLAEFTFIVICQYNYLSYIKSTFPAKKNLDPIISADTLGLLVE